MRSFKSSLDRAFVRSVTSNGTNERLYMMLCHSLIERASQYNDCMKELRRFVTCLSSSRNQSPNEAVAHHRFLAKPWLIVIQHLSGCEINVDDEGNASIHCNFYRRLPKTTTERVKYIFEKILDQRIPRRSSLYRVANELGNALSRSTWGEQLTYDVCQYLAIYQEGHRRLNILSKSDAKDKRATMRLMRFLITYVVLINFYYSI